MKIAVDSTYLSETKKKGGVCFLDDSGSDVKSLISYTSKHKFVSVYKLYAENGSEIETFGTKILIVNLVLRP